MKNNINPAVAAAVVVGILLIVGFFVFRGSGGQRPGETGGPGMPPEVAAEYNRRMNSGSTGPTAPR
jgi:hypothetical protein